MRGQAASGSAFALLLSGSVQASVPALPEGLRAPALGLLGASAAAVVALNLYVSYVDPRDVGGRGGFYCYTCETEVLQGSKHCRVCNKCVAEFDHHCKWLNTCIGALNYRGFLALLIVLTAHLSLEAAVAAYAVAQAFGSQGTGARLEGSRDRTSTAHRAAMVALLVASLLVLYAVGELLLFHLVLRQKQLTTYQFIMAAKDLEASDLECHMPCSDPKQPAARIHTTGLPVTLDHPPAELDGFNKVKKKAEEKTKKKLVKLNTCTLIRFTRTSDYEIGAPAPSLALVPLEGTPTKGKLAP